MAPTFLTISFLALVVLTQVHGRSLKTVKSCASGALYEIYPFDARFSFHSIMNMKDGVASIASCAALCLADDRCNCALYPGGNTCIWREDDCESSEMFISETPVTTTTGLIGICPEKRPNPPSRSLRGRIERYAMCGPRAKPFHGKKCCRTGDRCVKKGEYYAQCLPKSTPVPAGWDGEIFNYKTC